MSAYGSIYFVNWKRSFLTNTSDLLQCFILSEATSVYDLNDFYILSIWFIDKNSSLTTIGGTQKY